MLKSTNVVFQSLFMMVSVPNYAYENCRNVVTWVNQKDRFVINHAILNTTKTSLLFTQVVGDQFQLKSMINKPKAYL